MVRIAVDAMGGDHAPDVVIDGALRAAERYDDLQVLLVGPEDRIARGFEGRDDSRIEIVHAPDVVEMHEKPVEALRKKPKSSIRRAIGLLKEDKVDAVFSAGNTGAMVAASTMLLGLLPGVRRAGIAVTFPLGDRFVILIDVGANVSPKPTHLFQYGLMAKELISRVFDVKDPLIGILNVGEEDQKGTQLVRETKALFQASSLRFHGNVEGRDIFHGGCDVVVSDGFVGNIVLKVTEGLSEKIIQYLRREITAIDDMIGHTGPIHESLGRLATLVDYSEYGGAPLLGVNGTVIIGHGRSDAKAVANAIGVGRELRRHQVNEKIVEAVKQTVV